MLPLNRGWDRQLDHLGTPDILLSEKGDRRNHQDQHGDNEPKVGRAAVGLN